MERRSGRTNPFAAHGALGRLGWLRGALGGSIGIALAGFAGLLMIGHDALATLPFLVAPIGASAVLVFAVPASPLAQPRSVIGGNVLSAAIGLAVGHWVGSPLLAGSLAVGMAIAAMGLTRSLHPPGGACALLYAFGANGPETWGWLHLATIVADVLALSLAGWAYNSATGHPWPHRPVHLPSTATPITRSVEVHQALTEVLRNWNDVIDADIDDLEAIFQAVERRIGAARQDAPPASVI